MRIFEVDIARGLGILLVVIYHIFYDLNYFGIANFEMDDGILMVLGRLAAIILIFVVGVSLVLSYSRAENEGKNTCLKFAKRAAYLFFVSAVISVATWIYPHNGWIFWGIIQFIAFSVFACHFFAKYFKLNFILGVAGILIGFYLQNFATENVFLFILGVPANIYTSDYFPVFPWIGIVFLGMFFSKAVYKKRVFEGKNLNSVFGLIKIPHLKILGIMGTNSLFIYLLHQPVLVGLILLIKAVF
ncbi:MAG: heparan-alpha-glucosaminide N-acetyltransferase [Candidatus Micrarchaeota archaeon]